MDKKTLGALGEESAAEYLSKKGYHIIGRNVYIGHAEIDIIAENSTTLVFAEVKTRRQYPDRFNIFPRPADAVDERKRACLIRAAEGYIAKNKNEKSPRIDIIEVYADPSSDSYAVLDILHFERAVKKIGKFSRGAKGVPDR